MPPPGLIGTLGALVAVAGLAVSGAGAPAAGARDLRRPRVAISAPTGVGQSMATLRGTIGPPSGRRAVTYRWEYGTRAPRRHTVARHVRSARAMRVSGRLTGLRPATRYRYRLMATTCGGCRRGTFRSAVRTFTTRSAPPPAPAPPSAAAAPAAAMAPTYVNPLAGPVADPSVIDAGDGGHDYFLYATGPLFPLWRSPDLVHWTVAGNALAQRPAWTVQTGDWTPWAPAAIRRAGPCAGAAAPSCFVLYYTALHGSLTPRPHCIGVAVSSVPGGPFTDLGPLAPVDNAVDSSGRPIGCGDDAGYGNIDPAPFVDADGRAYLYVSTDRRSDGAGGWVLEPTISVIPLTDDLLHAAGPRQPLMKGDGGWELTGGGPLVEGPWMERRGSVYYLFFSGGDWRGAYGMGYATSASPTGPFVKAPENPILREAGPVRSAGGGMIVRGPAGGDWLVYHARAGTYDQPRTLRIDPVVWNADGTVRIAGPTTGAQAPVP
jgi:beta-xylosidase